MDSPTLLEEGINLMLFGMGFVFVFLTLLVFVTSLMSRIVTKIERNVGEIPEEGVRAPTSFIAPHHAHHDAVPVEDKTLISVITAAVHKYRSRS